MLKNQQALLHKGFSRRRLVAQRKNRAGISRRSNGPRIAQLTQSLKSVKKCWLSYLQNIDDEFFKSREARNDILDRAEKGRRLYERLQIESSNSYDMKFMGVSYWSSKTAQGYSVTTYNNFRPTVGQWARSSLVQRPGICKTTEGPVGRPVARTMGARRNRRSALRMQPF